MNLKYEGIFIPPTTQRQTHRILGYSCDSTTSTNTNDEMAKLPLGQERLLGEGHKNKGKVVGGEGGNYDTCMSREVPRMQRGVV